MGYPFKVNPVTGKLDMVTNPAEMIRHVELLDMPDLTGGNTDHDNRYALQGTFAAIPLPGVAGRRYWCTDILVMLRDTGGAWIEMTRGETVSRLAQLAERDHASLTNVLSDQHHARSHVITAVGDHTSGATPGQILQANASGLPVDATNTDAEVLAAVALAHVQGTDAYNLDDLVDVNAPAPAPADVLTWDNVAGEWINAPVAGGSTLLATLTNKAGADSIAGYVYRLDPDNNDSFDYSTEDEDAQVVVTPGVIANNALGTVVLSGYTDVYVTGTTTRGQLLYFSATNGQAKPSWYRNDGAFAQATASRAGAGLVKADVFERNQLEKYGVSGEMSASGIITVPLVGATNTGFTFVPGPGTGDCIIDIGAVGDWDNTYINRISASVKMPDGKWLIAFSPYSALGNHNGIGLATCPGPPFTAWTKSPHNPIIARVPATWRSNHILSPALVLDLRNNILHLWYLGTNQAGLASVQVGHAYCPADVDYTDDANWTNDENQYMPHGGLADALAVIQFGKVYLHVFHDTATGNLYLWYHNVATGAFTQFGLILSVGAGGTWDDVYVSLPGVFWDSGVFYAVYVGNDNIPPNPIHYTVGLATVTGTPFQVWTKWINNTIGSIIPYQVGKYNSWLNLQSQLIRLNRTFYLFSVGRRTAVDGGGDRVGLWKMEL